MGDFILAAVLLAIGDFAIPIVVAVAVLSLVIVAFTYSSFYVKVPPDQAAVFTGRGGKKIVTGGARLRMPVVERVDRMSLAPFEIPIALSDAVSGEGVKVQIKSNALVRFDSTQEALATSTQRFLNTPRETLKGTLTDTLSGALRSVIGDLTVEELNRDRTAFSNKVSETATPVMTNIGMQIDILTIKEISDEVGYLDAMGMERTAQVKSKARIGQAVAEKEATIAEAENRQAGAKATAEAEAEIAIAEQARDQQIAQSRAEVQAAEAKADQAGPFAKATAEKEVVTAEAERDAERERAGIAIEEQRVLRQEKAQQATVVVPAKARKEALVAESEGDQQAAVNRAAGRQAELAADGKGEAEARKAKAEAVQAELEAEAAGIEAKLLAEAKGKRELAEALNSFDPTAVQLQLFPDLIDQLPEMMRGAASAFEKVDHITMIDTGGGNGNAQKLYGQMVGMFAGGLQIAKDMGLDIPGLFSGNSSTTAVSEDPGDDDKKPATRAIPEAKAELVEEDKR